ncbi:hypothetical protein F2Q69_00055195 [Brassica cretica]|uniref:Uncharacterized protein n=1 Tax=Brassica cretica TaxID=69181 RepID=A0A8S9N0L2_BRACR|nr:hypothetical protein F2Q69_00055195 [Brassica cretica]
MDRDDNDVPPLVVVFSLTMCSAKTYMRECCLLEMKHLGLETENRRSKAYRFIGMFDELE